MSALILGLLLFLGVHSVRLLADDWRTNTITRIGGGPWKGMYSLLSVAGVVLIVWGYGLARAAPELWSPPGWTRPVTSALTFFSFYLIAAAYTPRTRIRAMIGHPMVAGTMLWALAHLLSSSRASDVLLFGGFLVWAAFAFRSLRRRDRAAGKTLPPGTLKGDLTALVIGGAVWVAFGLWVHRWITGVPVFG